MKTLEECAEIQGVSVVELDNIKSLNLHFSPIPNWYGCILGFDCPRCNQPIDWEWQKQLPQITTMQSTEHLVPSVKGAKLIASGHRWIRLECGQCQTILTAENFDS